MQIFLDRRSSHGMSRNPPRRPCRLKIEPARDSVDVEHLTGEIQTGKQLALHGFEVNFLELNSTGRNKLILEGALAFHLEVTSANGFGNFLQLLVGNISPLEAVDSLYLTQQ